MAEPEGSGTESQPDKKAEKKKQTMMVVIGAVGLILTYLMFRRSGGSSSSNTATGSVVGSSAYPYSSGTGYSSSMYAGDINTLYTDMQSLQSEMAGLSAGSVTSSTTPTAAASSSGGAAVATSGGAAVSAPTTPGMGQVDIGGKTYDWLGQVGGTQQNLMYNGYEVGGGAPVFFGNANGIAQGMTNVHPGADIYVPAEYGGLVSKQVDHRAF